MSYDIFSAAERNDYKRVKKLLDSGNDVNEGDWDRDATPLHLACAKGNLETIELLIDYGADVNRRNKYGRTPVHHLILNRYDNIAIWLIKHCSADPHIPDKKGVSAYDLAIRWLQEQLDEAIRTRGEVEDSDSDESSEEEPKKPERKPSKVTEKLLEEVMRIHVQGGSYKSIRVNSKHVVDEILVQMAEKMNLPPDYNTWFEMYEVIRKSERKMQRGENLFERKAKWPLIFGKTGNETHLHCHFLVRPKGGSPENVVQAYNKLAQI